MTKIYWLIAVACLVGAVYVTADTVKRNQRKDVTNLRSEAKGHVFEEDWPKVESRLAPIIQSGKGVAEDFFTYGLALHMQKMYARSIPMFEKAEAMGYSPGLCEYNIACGLAQTGESGEALDRLSKAVQKGFVDSEWIAVDTDLEPLHGESRFTEILDEAKRKEIEKNEEGPKKS